MVDNDDIMICMDCGHDVDFTDYDFQGGEDCTGETWGYCKACDAWTSDEGLNG